jgi:hypothetical protein
MKKILMTLVLAVAMMLATVPAWSLPFSFTAPTDSIVAYDKGNPSEANEKGYLATYLGLTVPQVEALYVFDKWEAGNGHPWNPPYEKDLSGGFNPGFSWDYAIVKVDGPNDYWYLFIDDNASLLLSGGDDVLTTPAQGTVLIPGTLAAPLLFNGGNYGISHVTWFRTTTEVPEPMTLILLGLGLLGIAGIRRK